jgi:hypothetical protein
LDDKVPTGAVFGYDLEVHIGLQRFLHYRQRSEIRDDLWARHAIRVSDSEISTLAARFLDHLARLHEHRAPLLRQALAADGGYPMHIDATGEGGRGTVFATYAGSRRWALGAWRLPTERAELILPCLQATAARFGAPLAIVRDLGKAVIVAALDLVAELALPIPILACHFHFLRDVGKDLLADGHDRLREQFQRLGTRAALRALARDLGRRLGNQLPILRGQVAEWLAAPGERILPPGPQGLATVRALAQWALDYAAGARSGFPFSTPFLTFYHRCLRLGQAVDAFSRCEAADPKVQSALRRLARILEPIRVELPFVPLSRQLEIRSALFERLRDALRLRSDGQPSPPLLTPEQAAEELQDIRQAVAVLSQRLQDERPRRGPAQATRAAIDLILEHLERHGEALWGHVVRLPPEVGGGIRVVDRTNQILEAFWHQMKHSERRRSGRKVLTYDFESLPAAAVLARNLQHEDYVAILCGDLSRLPHAFAELDRILAKAAPAGAQPDATLTTARVKPNDLVTASLPRSDLKLVRKPDLGETIRTAAGSRNQRRQGRQC